MVRAAMFFLILLVPGLAISGERISGTNTYVIHQDTWNMPNLTYWRQDNIGTFSVKEGPLDPGFVRCIGAGFGGPTGVSGGGICIFGSGDDTFTWSWERHKSGPNTWKVVDATGKYSGMTGKGTSRTRADSQHLKMPQRISDWTGEIEMPKK